MDTVSVHPQSNDVMRHVRQGKKKRFQGCRAKCSTLNSSGLLLVKENFSSNLLCVKG